MENGRIATIQKESLLCDVEGRLGMCFYTIGDGQLLVGSNSPWCKHKRQPRLEMRRKLYKSRSILQFLQNSVVPKPVQKNLPMVYVDDWGIVHVSDVTWRRNTRSG